VAEFHDNIDPMMTLANKPPAIYKLAGGRIF